MKTLSLSIVIPAHNEEKYLRSCLESLLRERTNAVAEILVIDNASTDGTAALAASFPGVRVVLENQKGLLFARQRGFLESAGDLLAYVDADCQIRPGWYAEIERSFQSDPSLICLSGPCTYAPEEIGPIRRFLANAFWTIAMPVTYYATGYMVVGGNFIARRDALQKIGGFDTSVEFYSEDANTGRRLHTVGKVTYSRRLRCYASARRLREHGVLMMGLIYSLNFVWDGIFHRPFTKKSDDIR